MTRSRSHPTHFAGLYLRSGFDSSAVLPNALRAGPVGAFVVQVLYVKTVHGRRFAVVDAGLNVPRDVSVMGFDGSPEGALCWPGLSRC